MNYNNKLLLIITWISNARGSRCLSIRALSSESSFAGSYIITTITNSNSNNSCSNVNHSSNTDNNSSMTNTNNNHNSSNKKAA